LKKEIWNKLYSFADDCYKKGMGFEKIHETLMKEHSDEALVYAVVKKIKSDHYAEIRKHGLLLLGIGCALILTGFLITCANFHANKSITFAMYGLTSIGITIVFWGLYKIIG